MENNKLDNLFRNKLKDVKVPPPEGTWEAIAEKLPNKKKNRVIMLWWSVAAVLLALIGSSVFFWTVSDSESQKIEIVDIESQSEISIEKQQDNAIAIEDEKLGTKDTKKPKEDAVTIDHPTESKYNTLKNKAVVDKYLQEKAVAVEETEKEKSTSEILNAQNAIVQEQIDKKEKKKLFAKQDVLVNDGENKGFVTEQIAQTKPSETENIEAEVKQEVLSLVSKNGFFAVEEATDNSKSKEKSKWSVGPQVAPVYYNSLSGGSSLDSQFNDSGKEGDVNMSLGLQVAYQINDNWQVRSGINKMDVGYATNNVQVGYSDPNLAIYNINYGNVSDGGVVITAFSNENLSSIRESNLGHRVELLYIEGNTQLKQSISYLEIPIEIERKLINSDFEWSIIGGVSSLFLTDNEIYVSNSEYSSHIGSASNLEKTSFTTNIGMGFGYNFTKRVHLQLEPMFKYQLNAYTNSVNFKPYIFGVYTGVRWRLD